MPLFALAAVSLVIAPVPKSARFGSWVVACDNGRHCEGFGLPPEDGGGDWTFYVKREADASATPTIAFDPAFGDWEGEQRAVRLVIDGRRTEFGLDAQGKVVGDSMRIIAAIASATKVSVVDLNGRALGIIPVKGASAALRWIDDRQKRAGTVTAMIARGHRPISAVPRRPALPRIQQPPASRKPARQLTAADVKAIRSGKCNSERDDATTFRLDDLHTLGIVLCDMGAYQGSSLIVVIDERGRWFPASIEQSQKPDEYFEPQDAWTLTGADYVERERLLFMAAKGRGLGDCGSSGSWAWDGRMFRLASYQLLEVCSGAPPGTWFSRWQTANDPLTDD